MAIMTWDPFQTLSALQSDIDRLLDQRLPAGGSQAAKGFSPLANIYEDKNAYHFEIGAPGMSRDQFKVSVEDNVLSVTGERKREEESKDREFHRVEWEYGSFSRSFWLPETADTEKIEAAYEQGVLKITIAKKEAAKPRQIEVKVAA